MARHGIAMALSWHVRLLTLGMQASGSSGSLSSAGGQSASGGTDYLKSALDASAAQKETFFARKMEVITAVLLQ